MYCFASNKYNLTHHILAGHNDQIIINFSNLTNIEDMDEIKKIKMFQNNISENPIEFDTYYEDGLMNA
jgi:ribosomal 30S subunit maturation factor RimM